MNEGLHFFTGYLIALAYLKPKDQKRTAYWGFGAFIGGFSGLLPDVGELFGNFGHGTWTHTILVASLMAVVLASIIILFARDLLFYIGIQPKQLVMLMWLAAMSHLVLDIFTHQQFECVQAELDFKHIYFWPFWGQSFHMDCLFGWSYLVRIVVEWAIYLPIIVGILFYRHRKYGENPFASLNFHHWDLLIDPRGLTQGIPPSTEGSNKVQMQRNMLGIAFYAWILAYAVLYIIF
jgi:membrane-bound metal-dependent hydrolase YbcI (DUF457 family)